jgi:hypothetical protein
MKPIKNIWAKWQALQQRSDYVPNINQQNWEINDRPFNGGKPDPKASLPTIPTYEDVERQLDLLRQLPTIKQSRK